MEFPMYPKEQDEKERRAKDELVGNAVWVLLNWAKKHDTHMPGPKFFDLDVGGRWIVYVPAADGGMERVSHADPEWCLISAAMLIHKQDPSLGDFTWDHVQPPA